MLPGEIPGKNYVLTSKLSRPKSVKHWINFYISGSGLQSDFFATSNTAANENIMLPPVSRSFPHTHADYFNNHTNAYAMARAIEPILQSSAKRPQLEAASQHAQAIQSVQLAVEWKFRWIRTSQNCSIWAEAKLNPSNVIEIESCKDGKAYGYVVFKSGSFEGWGENVDQMHVVYYYDGFAVSLVGTGSKDRWKQVGKKGGKDMLTCFEHVKAYKPKFHALPNALYPVIYVAKLSDLSDNELVSKFGAGTTIWMDIAPGMATGETYAKKGLCGTDPLNNVIDKFDVIDRIFVGIQNASQFEDVPAPVIEHLISSVLKFTLGKRRDGKLGVNVNSPWSKSGSRIVITDENLAQIFVESLASLDRNKPEGVSLGLTRNYVQEARAAERAQKYEDERRARVKASFEKFLQQTGATELLAAEDLQSNPFRFEGTNIAVLATYQIMVDKNTSIFATEKGVLTVLGLDPKHSMGQGTDVVLAGKVTGTRQVPTPMGGSITAPLLSFQGIHLCQIKGCADILPK